MSKPLDNYYNKKSEKDNKHRYCKECQKTEGKQYYSTHKEEHNTRTKKWTLKNKDYHKSLMKDHYHNNKDYYREWNQNKMDTDPLFRLKHAINALINFHLKYAVFGWFAIIGMEQQGV